MNFANDFGAQAIKDVVEQHPTVGAILNRHEIACVTCGVGICHLKDVVSIHGLSTEEEAEVEREINDYLKTR